MRRLLSLSLLFSFTLCSGCAVLAVADVAVSVAANAISTTAKAAGAVVDAVIPDGDDKSAEKTKE